MRNFAKVIKELAKVTKEQTVKKQAIIREQQKVRIEVWNNAAKELVSGGMAREKILLTYIK
jgi:hypothetical protein